MLSLATRLNAVLPSATVAISDRAKKLKAQGQDIISFSLGEPDFRTPDHICEAAKRAIDQGATHYTAARGIPELRAAICDDSRRRRGGPGHTPDEVVVSVGAKHALFNLALALYEPGDEVIIPAPYWVSYPEHVRLAGAEPRIVEAIEKDGFCLLAKNLERAVTEKTKALVLCSPSNPTGAAYSEDALRALLDVARRHQFWIIADEIYGELVYGGFRQRSVLELAPDLRQRIILVDGVSKTYAMTGWRIGWILAPAHVAEACDTIQGQSTTNPTAVAQHAAFAALRGSREPLETMRQAFERRRDVMVEGLNAIAGVKCRIPEGAFYAFPDVRAWIGRSAGSVTLKDDVAVANWLLESALCAVVPGSAFGAPGYLRLSYATSEELIAKGLGRMRDAVARLS